MSGSGFGVRVSSVGLMLCESGLGWVKLGDVGWSSKEIYSSAEPDTRLAAADRPSDPTKSYSNYIFAN